MRPEPGPGSISRLLRPLRGLENEEKKKRYNMLQVDLVSESNLNACVCQKRPAQTGTLVCFHTRCGPASACLSGPRAGMSKRRGGGGGQGLVLCQAKLLERAEG